MLSKDDCACEYEDAMEHQFALRKQLEATNPNRKKDREKRKLLMESLADNIDWCKALHKQIHNTEQT